MPEWKQEIRRRLANLKLAPTREAAIVEEVEQHLADFYAEELTAGATEAQAYQRSLAELDNNAMLWRELRHAERHSGNVVVESTRRRNVIANLWQDLRFGSRMLVKQPGFTLIAVITLALGIGANTAIFSVIYAVLLRPLPYPAAERLVILTTTGTNVDLPTYLSYPDYVDLRDRTHSFDDTACFVDDVFNVTGVDPPVAVDGRRVNWNFFQILGVKPQIGRLFTPSDDQAGAVPTATISDALWHEKFGGDDTVIGKTISLDGGSFTVIGVLPPDFEFQRHDDVFVPLGLWFIPGHNLLKRDNSSSHVLARLKAGVTLTQARTDLSSVAAQLEHEYPQTNRGRGAGAERLSDLLVKDVRPVLLVLLTAVGCVLLIACVNVTNLMLVRAAGREGELSVRLALGARSGRIIQQMLTESMMIAALGGLAGLLLAAWGVSSLGRLIPPALLRLDQIRLNTPVLLFALGISALTGLLFGLLPALQTARADPNKSLKQGGRSIGRSGWDRARKSLLVAEVSLALVLLVGAGLMLRTLQQLTRVNLGFDAANLLTLRFQLPNNISDNERRLAFFRECRMRLDALPGVRSASFVMSLPLQGASWNLPFIVADKPVPGAEAIPHAAFIPVSANFFATMAIPVRAGRAFTEPEMNGTPAVTLINESLAHRLWPGENAVGKRLRQGGADSQAAWREVIGVVADVRLNGLEQEAPLQVYLPLALHNSGTVKLVVRTDGEPLAFSKSIEQTIHSINKDLTLESHSMDELLGNAMARQRLTLTLLAILAVLALSLAAIGIYGVMSYAVTERRKELGIRLALGATLRDVLLLVLVQGMKPTLLGVALGSVAALAATRLLRGLLYGVAPTDPLTFIGVAVLLSGVALVACWLPARRATKVDPLVALRYE
jgi:putative ABC transport system permease protein